jgi:hypothetical protein
MSIRAASKTWRKHDHIAPLSPSTELKKSESIEKPLARECILHLDDCWDHWAVDALGPASPFLWGRPAVPKLLLMATESAPEGVPSASMAPCCCAGPSPLTAPGCGLSHAIPELVDFPEAVEFFLGASTR